MVGWQTVYHCPRIARPRADNVYMTNKNDMFAAVLLEDYTGEFLMLKLFNSSDDCVNFVEDRNQYAKGGYWKVVDEDEML